MKTLVERERRLSIARALSEIEMTLGTLALVLPIVWIIAAPTTLGGPMGQPVSRPPVEIIAYFGIVLGYAWMRRIRFKGPEDGARSNWRSH